MHVALIAATMNVGLGIIGWLILGAIAARWPAA